MLEMRKYITLDTCVHILVLFIHLCHGQDKEYGASYLKDMYMKKK